MGACRTSHSRGAPPTITPTVSQTIRSSSSATEAAGVPLAPKSRISNQAYRVAPSQQNAEDVRQSIPAYGERPQGHGAQVQGGDREDLGMDIREREGPWILLARTFRQRYRHAVFAFPSILGY